MTKQILDLTGLWQFKEYPVSARRMRDLDEQNWLLKLKASVVIKDLYIDMPFDAELSDNFFDLLPDGSKTITIHTEEVIDDLPEKISFTSINSIFVA